MPPGAIDVVPDWVCEVLLPTTRRDDVLIKMPKYEPFDEVPLNVAPWWLPAGSTESEGDAP